MFSNDGVVGVFSHFYCFHYFCLFVLMPWVFCKTDVVQAELFYSFPGVTSLEDVPVFQIQFGNF